MSRDPQRRSHPILGCLFLLSALAAGREATAQVCGQVDDLAVHLPPYYTGTQPILRPELGRTIYDIGFGCPLRRITDDTVGPQVVPALHAGTFDSAALSSFSKNGSLILLSRASPVGNYLIDRTGSVARSALPTGLSCTDHVYPWMQPRWSSTDPLILYYHSNPAESQYSNPACRITDGTSSTYKNHVYRYDASTNATTEVTLHIVAGPGIDAYRYVSFGEAGGGSPSGEADVSANGDYVALGGKLSAAYLDSFTKFRILNLATGDLGDEIHGSPSDPYFGTSGFSIDWCEVLPLSRNIVCRFDRSITGGVFHRIELFKGFAGTYRGVSYASGQYIQTVLNWNGHADRGIDTADTDGIEGLDEILVVMNNSQAKAPNGDGCTPPGVEKIRIPDGHRTCLVDDIVTGAVHISINNTLAADGTAPTHPWTLISTYANGDGEQKFTLANNWESKWNVMDNELVLARLDGTQVRRLAHHRNRTDDTAGGGPTFGSLSTDGTAVLFDTDLGTTSNDVYVLSTATACNLNGVCDAGESCKTCPGDCAGTPICSSAVCDAGEGEASSTCGADCRSGCGPVTGQHGLCSQGFCSSGGFTCTDAHDQGYCCGDGTCSSQENPTSCPLDCPPPPSACPQGLGQTGSVIVFPQPRQLVVDGPQMAGDNFVAIPAFSPVNDNPTNGLKNGFQQLCDIFGLRGTTSSIYQINAAVGATMTFTCNQPGSAPEFMPCQGVVIQPSGVSGAILGTIPVGHNPDGLGVEGSWHYPAYTDGFGSLGDNIFGVPLTIVSLSPEVLCQQLGLPTGSSIIRFYPSIGNSNTHSCGQGAPQFELIPGEAVLIRPFGAAGAGGYVLIN